MRHTKKTTLQLTRITGSDETGKDRHSYLNLAHVNPEIVDDNHLEALDKAFFRTVEETLL